jgi:hypothetical protein
MIDLDIHDPSGVGPAMSFHHNVRFSPAADIALRRTNGRHGPIPTNAAYSITSFALAAAWPSPRTRGQSIEIDGENRRWRTLDFAP